jgi:precorrin-6A/cobalt-precorrin-6A reductase
LGGSTEASLLARGIAGDATIAPILSFAGRTKNPVAPPIPFRVGGFGGVAGLTEYLRREAIEIVIDATHPFAERMSANAEAACRAARVPLAIFTRAPWTPRPGDDWTAVPDAAAAAHAIGTEPRRVFLTIGRQQIAAFESAPRHAYLIRTIDPPDPAPRLPRYRLVMARGPFTVADEMQTMNDERIDMLVTKNSGGDAARAKLDAARALRVPVILIDPPPHRDALTFHRLDDVLAFLRDPSHRADP